MSPVNFEGIVIRSGLPMNFILKNKLCALTLAKTIKAIAKILKVTAYAESNVNV